MKQIEIPWLVLAVLVALAALQTARSWWLARRPAARAKARARRAVRGELEAEPLLRRHGYRVLERQPQGIWRIGLDGEPIDVSLRGDFLVTRRGRRFIADAKTGQRAPSIAHGPTRRQLLEYHLAFDVDGVLLVSPEHGTVQEVAFPVGRRSGPSKGAVWWLLAGAGAGGTIAWLAPLM